MKKVLWIAALLAAASLSGQDRIGRHQWVSAGVTGDVGSLAADGSRLYATYTQAPVGTRFAVALTSEDGGQTWSQFAPSQSTGPVGTGVITPDPSSTGTAYLGTSGCNPRPPLSCYGGIYKTSDGEEWRILATPSYAAVSALAIAPERPEIVYAAAFDWGDYLGFRTRDGGETWTRLPNAFPSTTHVILVDAEDPDVVYSGGDSGLRKSTDGGLSWSPGNLGLSPVLDLEQDTRLNRIYAATARGIYATSDAAASWTLIGFGQERVAALALDQASGRLYAATEREGVQVSADAGGTWSEVGMGLPQTPIMALALFRHSILVAAPEFSGIYRLQLHEPRGVAFR